MADKTMTSKRSEKHSEQTDVAIITAKPGPKGWSRSSYRGSDSLEINGQEFDRKRSHVLSSNQSV